LAEKINTLVRTCARQGYSGDGYVLGRKSPVADGRRSTVVGSVAGESVQYGIDVRDAVDQLPATCVEVVVQPDRCVLTRDVDRTCEYEGVVLQLVVLSKVSVEIACRRSAHVVQPARSCTKQRLNGQQLKKTTIFYCLHGPFLLRNLVLFFSYYLPHRRWWAVMFSPASVCR